MDEWLQFFWPHTCVRKYWAVFRRYRSLLRERRALLKRFSNAVGGGCLDEGQHFFGLRTWMPLYVYVYVYICIYVHVYTCIYVNMYIYVYKYMY